MGRIRNSLVEKVTSELNQVHRAKLAKLTIAASNI